MSFAFNFGAEEAGSPKESAVAPLVRAPFVELPFIFIAAASAGPLETLALPGGTRLAFAGSKVGA